MKGHQYLWQPLCIFKVNLVYDEQWTDSWIITEHHSEIILWEFSNFFFRKTIFTKGKWLLSLFPEHYVNYPSSLQPRYPDYNRYFVFWSWKDFLLYNHKLCWLNNNLFHMFSKTKIFSRLWWINLVRALNCDSIL